MTGIAAEVKNKIDGLPCGIYHLSGKTDSKQLGWRAGRVMHVRYRRSHQGLWTTVKRTKKALIGSGQFVLKAITQTIMQKTDQREQEQMCLSKLETGKN